MNKITKGQKKKRGKKENTGKVEQENRRIEGKRKQTRKKEKNKEKKQRKHLRALYTAILQETIVILPRGHLLDFFLLLLSVRFLVMQYCNT